jgi:hypothetical protein
LTEATYASAAFYDKNGLEHWISRKKILLPKIVENGVKL